MACEDFPCCGHESGCCPVYDEDGKRHMVCTCGAVLPLNARYSICDGCMRRGRDDDEYPFGDPTGQDEDY